MFMNIQWRKKEQTKLSIKNMYKEIWVDNILIIYLLLNNKYSQQLMAWLRTPPGEPENIWSYDKDTVVYIEEGNQKLQKKGKRLHEKSWTKFEISPK